MDIELVKKAQKAFEWYDKAVDNSIDYLNLEREEQQDAWNALDKLFEAIARQSVTDEEVRDAIELIKDIQHDNFVVQDYTDVDIKNYELLSLAITALQAYQPWIPVSERLPEEDDASKKGDVLCWFSDGAVETWPWNEITEWNNNSLRVDEGFDGITHWRSMLPEPPKGE